MGLRLFHQTHSSSSWRVRIALAIKQLAYESSLIDLSSGEHLGDAYRAKNPLGQVPCLEVDGVLVAQSVAIIEYIEESWPIPSVLPENALDRARARAIAETINAGIQAIHNSGLSQSWSSPT